MQQRRLFGFVYSFHRSSSPPFPPWHFFSDKKSAIALTEITNTIHIWKILIYITTSFGGSLRKEKFTSLTVLLRTWLRMSSPRPSPHLKSSILLVNWPHHNLRGIVGMANIHGPLPLSVSLRLTHYLKHSIDNTHYLFNI